MTDINDAKRALLAQWEKERDELTPMINRLRRELGEAAPEPSENQRPPGEPPPPGAEGESVRPGDFFGLTQEKAAREFLVRRNRVPAELQDIGTALFRGKAISTPYTSENIRNLSSVLSRSDDFISVARGRWGLSEWYPGKVKKNRRPKTDTEAPNKEG